MSPTFKRPTEDGSSYHTTHYAAKMRNDGAVSALCFAKPRAIDLKRATWTNRKVAVTCKKCLARIATTTAELERLRAQKGGGE